MLKPWYYAVMPRSPVAAVVLCLLGLVYFRGNWAGEGAEAFQSEGSGGTRVVFEEQPVTVRMSKHKYGDKVSQVWGGSGLSC